MKADLVAREPQRLQQWQTAGLYQQIQAARAGAPRFVLHDGPPFANGDVHIGTALNKILKDIIVKYQDPARLQTRPTCRAGTATACPSNSRSRRNMRKAGRHQRSIAAAIRKACEAYARKFIDLQRAQFKRLGVLGDWENPYLTLNKEYEADELRLFADIVEKGFVYRGKKPVYWSIPCRTALAEAEVEYHDHVSQSVFVKFPVVGQPGTFVVIWTTTPWTLPANLAVAYNSTLQLLAGAGRRRELHCVSRPACRRSPKNAAGTNYQTVRTLARRANWPRSNTSIRSAHRTGKLFAGDFCRQRHRHRLCAYRARPRPGRLQSRPPERPADLFAGG